MIDVSEIGLQDLPAELFDTIFTFLPLNDLANMSLTCKKYKLLAENYFQRYHKNEMIHIHSNKTVEFHVKGNRYKIRFRYFIRSLEVDFETSDSVTETFLFIKRHCAPNLLSLLLWSYDDEISNGMNDTDFEIILDQLQHVEILLLKDVCAGFFMKHCKNIKTLGIANVNGIDLNRNDWIVQTNPKLETLMLDYPLIAEAFLTNFLRMNPQLKTFVAKDCNLTLSCFCSTGSKLQYAAIDLSAEFTALSVLDKIKDGCNGKSVKSLDLLLNNHDRIDQSFDAVTLQTFFRIKCANGFHFVVTPGNSSIVDTLVIQSHIERLCITFKTNVTANTSTKIVNCFPQLRFISICCHHDVPSEPSAKELIMPFISHSSKLEVIHFISFRKRGISKNDAVELNRTRSKMSAACKVTIKTNKCIPSKHRFIEINRCDHWLCPLCDGTGTTIDSKLLDYVLDISNNF